MGDANSRLKEERDVLRNKNELNSEPGMVEGSYIETGPTADEDENEMNCTNNESAEIASLSSVSCTGTATEKEDEEEEIYAMSCNFQVILKSQLTGERKCKELKVEKYPRTGLDLKKRFEAHFNIPVCVQNLAFYNTTIHNDTVLKKLRIQHGDTLHLEYTSEVDIDYFSSLINTLSRILAILQVVVPELENGANITEETHDILEEDCMAFTGDCIPLRYFSVFPTGTPNANQLYFIHNDGLHLLLQVYKLIHKLSWHSLPAELQELEFSCLQIIWNFSATLGIRYLILQEGIMTEVFHSLLRIKVVPCQPVSIPDSLRDPFASLDRSTYVLAETIYAAIVVIGNFAEIPSCRVPIASEPAVIDNMMAAMLSSTYTYTCARSAMCALLCISFSPGTHGYFYKEPVLRRILEICKRTHTVNDGTPSSEKVINQTLVEFYALIFFANLLHHWSDDHPLFDDSVTLGISDFMDQYLSRISHTLIHQHMQEKRYYWSTFIPFLSLCYSPPAHSSSGNKLGLRLLCIKSGLLSVKCMCVADNATDVIEHEGLLDFITCLPWFMPDEETATDARNVIQIAQQNLTFHPPSLTNIVKAFLASHYYGMDRVLNCDVHSILNSSVSF